MQAAIMIPSARSDIAALGPLSHYTIRATIDLERPGLHGSLTLLFTNSETLPLSELYFGAYPNAPFYGGRLDVANVSAGGQVATTSWEEENTALRVSLPVPLAPRAAITVSLDFTTTASTSESSPINFSDDILALASWYPIMLVHDADGWHTELAPEIGDLVYSRVALYTVSITSPSGLVVVASGIPDGAQRTGSATKTQTFHTGPVRDFYIVASNSFCVTSRQVGETIVNSYYPAGKDDVGRRVAEVAATMMATLGERAGLYPYREFDVAAAAFPARGIEYPGVVIILKRYYDSTPNVDLEVTVAHEAAHQWWYGVVGDDQVREPWVDEALAHFSTSLYWEKAYGQRAMDGFISEAFLLPYRTALRSGADMPVNLPVSAYTLSKQAYGAFVYDKGALFFTNLRQTIGDEAFFRFLREYYSTFKYKIAHGDDLLKLAKAIGGPSVQQVYDTWILGRRE